jgi:hypothetical protein
MRFFRGFFKHDALEKGRPRRGSGNSSGNTDPA